jgi:hypothetical protein
MFLDAENAYDFGPDVAVVVIEYLQAQGPYQPYTDGRITMITEYAVIAEKDGAPGHFAGAPFFMPAMPGSHAVIGRPPELSCGGEGDTNVRTHGHHPAA